VILFEISKAAKIFNGEVRIQPALSAMNVMTIGAVFPFRHVFGEAMVNRIGVYVVHDFAEIGFCSHQTLFHIGYEKSAHSVVFIVEALRIAAKGIRKSPCGLLFRAAFKA
jgi:hypothetical protein